MKFTTLKTALIISAMMLCSANASAQFGKLKNLAKGVADKAKTATTTSAASASDKADAESKLGAVKQDGGYTEVAPNLLKFRDGYILDKRGNNPIVYTPNNGRDLVLKHTYVESKTPQLSGGHHVMADHLNAFQPAMVFNANEAKTKLGRPGSTTRCDMFPAYSVIGDENADLEGTSWTSGAVKVSISGTTLTVEGNGAMADYQYGTGRPWASHRNEITKIVVKEGVRQLGGYAFVGFTAVTDIQLPSSLAMIGEGVFESCTSLVTITLPANLFSGVNPTAFRNCTSLTDIKVAQGSPLKVINGGVYNAKKEVLLVYPCGRKGAFKTADECYSIMPYCFYNCQGLTEITLGAEFEDLADGTFDRCNNLKKITFLGKKPVLFDPDRTFPLVHLEEIEAYVPAASFGAFTDSSVSSNRYYKLFKKLATF